MIAPPPPALNCLLHPLKAALNRFTMLFKRLPLAALVAVRGCTLVVALRFLQFGRAAGVEAPPLLLAAMTAAV
jgi:hypothetical protein